MQVSWGKTEQRDKSVKLKISEAIKAQQETRLRVSEWLQCLLESQFPSCKSAMNREGGGERLIVSRPQ